MRRLGKEAYEHDARTLMLSSFVLPEIHVPVKHDFDKGRRPIPIRMMGNDVWGNCVVVGEANHVLRLERVEQRRTIKLTDADVINRYKSMTGAQSPNDANDSGLVVLQAMRNWKNEGFKIGNRTYSISAYGELEPHDQKQLRMACYVFHGVHFGFWLPSAAQHMGKVWDYNGQTGPEWKPGSWGGHLVYGKAFDQESFEVITWGEKVKVTNAFIERYCDEAWAAVDNFDSWRTKQTVDVAALRKKLSEITTRVDN